MKIYVVFGQTGEYSDHKNWPVRWFHERARAETFELERTKEAMAYVEKRSSLRASGAYDWDDEDCDLPRALKDQQPKDDPGFKCNYTGTDYYTLEVEGGE